MYKAIIIDDEPWTILDIEQTFALENMGFEIVGSFRSPLKALPFPLKGPSVHHVKEAGADYHRYSHAWYVRTGVNPEGTLPPLKLRVYYCKRI